MFEILEHLHCFICGIVFLFDLRVGSMITCKKPWMSVIIHLSTIFQDVSK